MMMIKSRKLTRVLLLVSYNANFRIPIDYDEIKLLTSSFKITFLKKHSVFNRLKCYIIAKQKNILPRVCEHHIILVVSGSNNKEKYGFLRNRFLFFS